MPDSQNLIGCAHVSNPVEGAQISLQRRIQPKRLIDREPLAHHSKNRSIFGRSQRYVIGCNNTAAAGHIDGHQGRLAGYVAPDVAREQAGVGIIAAANAGANDESDLFAGIKLRYCISGRRGGNAKYGP